eukprot:m.37184 g.37184  ORF g.37184 m.37184 type:complete len:476 (+) comp11516_c0_seq1:158-1585(+)
MFASGTVVLATVAHAGDKNKDPCIDIWDPTTDLQIGAFRGGVCAPHGLAMTQTHVFALQAGRPSLHMWTWSSETALMKIPMPEPLSSVACTPDGIFCFGGCDSGKIYVWHIASGALLKIVSGAHYRRVTSLVLTRDSSALVSASEDATVRVWPLGSLVDTNSDSEPQFVWSDHALPVTDVYCGFGGSGCRIATVSRDRTCKIYELASGRMLASVLFPSELTAVCMDASEQCLYVGAADGAIYQLPLQGRSEDGDFIRARDLKPTRQQTFIGHSKAITSLDVQSDGTVLCSSSEDGQVLLWHTDSCQNIRALQCSAPVTNARFCARSLVRSSRPVAPPVVFARSVLGAAGLGALRLPTNQAGVGMHVRAETQEAELDAHSACVWGPTASQILQSAAHPHMLPSLSAAAEAATSGGDQNIADQLLEENRRLKEANAHWQTVAQQLYELAARDAFAGATPTSSSSTKPMVTDPSPAST